MPGLFAPVLRRRAGKLDGMMKNRQIRSAGGAPPDDLRPCFTPANRI
jgi:hypothetical protein